MKNLSRRNKWSLSLLYKSIFLLFFLLIFVLQAVNQSKAETINKYIPSLNATVTKLRFLEHDFKKRPAYGQREYKRRFPKSSSRTISWEIYLEYPKTNRRIDFEIKSIFYRPDGSIFSRQQSGKDFHIKSDWGYSQHTMGTGWREPGKWKIGAYRVDLFIKDKKVASGTFEIYSSEKEPVKPFIPPEKEKPSGDIEIPDDLGEL